MPATLTAYRQALILALNDGGIFSVTSATSSTVVAGGLINNATNASTGRFNGHWINHIIAATGATQQRIVKPNSYVPSTGTLEPNLAWTTPTAGDVLEITSMFPPIQQSMSLDTDYRTIINRALGKLLVPDQITLAITTSDTYALTAYRAWLDRPERLVRVREPSPVTGRAPVDMSWRGWRLVLNGELPVLELKVPFASATGSLTLDVMRTAKSWVSTSGTWAESTTGLTNNGDEALPSVEDALPQMLVEAYQVLMSRSPGRPNGNWSTKYADAREQAQAGRYFDRSSVMTAAPEAAGEAA
jgi:hypothetical protein